MLAGSLVWGRIYMFLLQLICSIEGLLSYQKNELEQIALFPIGGMEGKRMNKYPMYTSPPGPSG